MQKWLKIIKKIRKQRRVSQIEMAHVLGVNQSNYSRMESGETSMTLNQFESVMFKLNLSVVLIDPTA
jgi:transcriptional regulator with XRE-family HTH domain